MMHTNNFDERELVDRARKDPAAFGRLFDAHYDAILNYILHRTADVHLAHELASNTFFIALRKLWQFKWRKVPFSAWLYRIAIGIDTFVIAGLVALLIAVLTVSSQAIKAALANPIDALRYE